MLIDMRPIKSSNIIYAADLENCTQVVGAINELHPYIGVVKVAPHIMICEGLESILEQATNHGLSVFLDLKLHDIPQTVYNAVKMASKKGASMITVHICGGKQMLEAALSARKEGGSKIAVLGVTKLTSLAITDASEVVSMAMQAQACGLDGVICSAFESRQIKELCGASFITVTPGIRLADSNNHDQARVATPRYSIDNMADYMVIGRLITEANDKPGLMRKILAM